MKEYPLRFLLIILINRKFASISVLIVLYRTDSFLFLIIYSILIIYKFLILNNIYFIYSILAHFFKL